MVHIVLSFFLHFLVIHNLNWYVFRLHKVFLCIHLTLCDLIYIYLFTIIQDKIIYFSLLFVPIVSNISLFYLTLPSILFFKISLSIFLFNTTYTQIHGGGLFSLLVQYELQSRGFKQFFFLPWER